MNGALILRGAIWLSVPIYWQLHWLFPSPLKPLPRWMWTLLYALSTILVLLSWFQLMPSNLYMVGFLAALLGSLILLGMHLATQPTERHLLTGLVVAIGMVLIPVLAILIISILKIPFKFNAIIVLGLAALPGFYFITLYRRQLTPGQERQSNHLVRLFLVAIITSLLFSISLAILAQNSIAYQYFSILGQMSFLIALVIALVNFLPFLVLPALANKHLTVSTGSGQLSFSANRAAPAVFFILIETMGVVLGAALFQLLNFPGVGELSLVLAVLVMGTGALLFYGPFQRFFERTVLGISLQPEALTRLYAGRITTSLEAAALQKLLLVRQFAQVLLQDVRLQLDFGLRADGGMLSEATRLDSLCGTLLDAENSPLPAWIRLVLALQSGGETRGYWLLGQRDPDDHYSTEDIATLQALADQTALALVNIQQADNLRTLYVADIDRNETERLHLAAELHDDVLSQMAVLSQNLDSSSTRAIKAYDEAVVRIREIINGLRPAMLNFGLRPALETLTDELNERLPDGPKLKLEMPESLQRYDSRVELYLFRVAQQACSNAIQHAECKTIRISGMQTETEVEVSVTDDGQGFPAGEGIDLPALLVGKHFGLAGMFERAALIGAEFNIQSQPGEGTRVSLKWSASPAGTSSR